MNQELINDINNILSDEKEFEEFKKYMDLGEDFSNQNDFNNKNSNKNEDSFNNNQDFFQDFLKNSGGMNFDFISNMTNMFNLFNQNPENDENTKLLLSLKPFLHKNRQEKIDMVINLLKIMKLLPLITQLNLFEGNEQNETT